MRDNRNKWQFYNHPSKIALTANDTRYWKQSLKKLLKVGIEFEFNLQEQKGKCKGDNVQCPCIHINKGCWKSCQNCKNCESVTCFDTCANKQKSCDYKKCKTCENYKLDCLGTCCVEFISTCFICTKFGRNCDTCVQKYDPKSDPKAIRKTLGDEFQPSHHYGLISPSGVVSITTDGSLLGDKGLEIITVGRRVDYWEFYTMSKKILDKAVSMGGYLNERCGAHMHLLASYYESENMISEMEKDMPEIILANFHQLCRRYQNAITWMTIALDDPEHMTRWEKFRVSVLGISPVAKDMYTVVDEVARNAGGCKYGWVNYNRTSFVAKNKINRFHVEMRAADATLCPTVYAALACLYYALAIKAVEISRYGLLKVGEEKWLKRAKTMKEALMNNCSDYGDSTRLSNTKEVLDYKEDYIKESLDLISQLKGILMKLGPAHDVLVKLAERPAALRRINGDTWQDIERDLEVQIGESDHIEFKLNEIVDLRIIEDCRTLDEWVTEVNRILTEDEEIDQKIGNDEIEEFVNIKMREGEVVWSDSIGSVVPL